MKNQENLFDLSSTASLMHPALASIAAIRQEYIKNRYAFIPGRIMQKLLQFLGASSDDLKRLEYSGNGLREDPTLAFRKSRNGRFLIDFKETKIKRLEFQPFVLSAEEDFIRDDSGLLRHFRGIQDELQLNTAFQALLSFKSLIIDDLEIAPRKNLKLDFDKWVTTVFQLRTITTPSLVGEPAKEGVHSDGVEHTMTTFLLGENMTLDSAISQIHTADQKNGIPWNATNKNYVVGQVQHQHFLDTLLIVDSELKHSVSPVEAFDKNSNALRDMLIFFTRRPKSDLHTTFKYDSLNLHPEIPFEFKISKN